MTIGAWITCIIGSIILLVGGGTLAYATFDAGRKTTGIITIIVTIMLIVGLFLGFSWYYSSTASGQRELIDEKSNFNNGIERIINVYTANGEKIATFEGKIDIDTNDGGYVKFDYEGKRYIYYNCFIETIAEIPTKN